MEVPEQLKDFRNFLYIVWKELNLPDPTPIQYEIADVLITVTLFLAVAILSYVTYIAFKQELTLWIRIPALILAMLSLVLLSLSGL